SRKASEGRRPKCRVSSDESDSAEQTLLHQQNRATALDFASDLPVHIRRHAGNATGKNFAALSHEFLQQIRILVIDCFYGDVDPASRHGPIRAAKCGTTFWRFWLHGWLFGLAMQCAPPQKRIVFFLLQPVRRARTFLVTSRHITRRRFPKRLGLRAFESDNLLRHRTLLLRLRWSSFFLL